CACLDACDVAEKPRQKIESVDRLIDQDTTAVQRLGAAPSRMLVVFARAIPFDLRFDQQNLPEYPFVDPLFGSADVRLEAILESHTQLDGSLLGGLNQSVGANGTDVAGFFC